MGWTKRHGNKQDNYEDFALEALHAQYTSLSRRDSPMEMAQRMPRILRICCPGLVPEERRQLQSVHTN